ncbi:MAG: Colicin I receptor precursor [Bacteroidetes bacterium ADurb.Bin408]|nr:MAG: Colicin I receptor precursor [Bacteroidetes bacterium ADurb.Bin408]
MRRIIALLFLFLNCLPLFSQKTELTGVVTDAVTLMPLANAHIRLIETSMATSTDSGGFFRLSNINYGHYVLSVSFMGYRTYEKKVEVGKNSKTNFKIALKDSVFMPGTFVVSAPKEDLLAQPVRINLIQKNEIQQAPLQQINDLLSYSSGVNTSNTTGIFSGKTIVSLRGLPANEQARTLVILDDVPLNKSDEGSVNWNLLNKNNIEQVKIIKGPGSARYGSGAMGGVIEMTSAKPVKPFGCDVNLGYGNLNTLSANLTLSGVQKTDTLKTLYWLLSGFGRKSDGYITVPDVFRTIEDTILVPAYLNEINTLAKAGINFKKNQNAEIQFSFFDDKRGNGVKVFDDFGAYTKHLTYKGLARYSGHNKLIKWQSFIYNTYENYFRIYEYMNEGEYKLYQADAIRQDKGLQCDVSFFRFKNHVVGTGMSLKNGSVDGTDTYFTSTDIINNAGKMDNYALYVMDDITLNDRFLIAAGLRYDYASFYDARFSITYPSYSILFYQQFEVSNTGDKSWDALCPRLSLQYKLNEEKRLFLSFAKGFRAPVLDDMTRTGKKKDGFKVANPTLTPENIYTLEAGGDAKTIFNLEFNASVYYSLGYDFMYFSSTGDSVNIGYKLAPIFKKQNIGKVEIYGTELETKYKFNDKIFAFLNYTYAHAQIIEHKILNAQVDSNLTGKYLTDLPEHKCAAGVFFNNRFINTSLMLKYFGTTWINEWNRVDNEYFKTDKFPDYFIFNIRFEKEVYKRLTLYLNIENIFDKKYVDGNLEQNPGRFSTLALRFTL